MHDLNFSYLFMYFLSSLKGLGGFFMAYCYHKKGTVLVSCRQTGYKYVCVITMSY